MDLFSILNLLMPVIEWVFKLMGVSDDRKAKWIGFIEKRAGSARSNVDLHDSYAKQVKELKSEKQPGRDS